jgi:hypothetical protein
MPVFLVLGLIGIVALVVFVEWLAKDHGKL